MIATVMSLVLPMCILISCSSVLCVLIALGVYVCESYVVLDQCDEPSSLFVLSFCAYGGVVGYFWSFSFLCEFCFLYCDDVRLCAVYEVFQFLDFVSDVVYVDLKYDDVFVLWLIVVCEWLGCDLSAMGCCVGCVWRCCYELCRCVNGASPVGYCCFICVHLR